MWVKLMNGEIEDILQQLDSMADEKEASLESTAAGAGLQVMKDITLLRKSYGFLKELDKMRKAYEELLEIKWNHDGGESAVEMIVGRE